MSREETGAGVRRTAGCSCTAPSCAVCSSRNAPRELAAASPPGRAAGDGEKGRPACPCGVRGLLGEQETWKRRNEVTGGHERHTGDERGAGCPQQRGARVSGARDPTSGRRPRGVETGARVWMLEQIRRCVSGRKEARASGTSPPGSRAEKGGVGQSGGSRRTRTFIIR